MIAASNNLDLIRFLLIKKSRIIYTHTQQSTVLGNSKHTYLQYFVLEDWKKSKKRSQTVILHSQEQIGNLPQLTGKTQETSKLFQADFMKWGNVSYFFPIEDLTGPNWNGCDGGWESPR